MLRASRVHRLGLEGVHPAGNIHNAAIDDQDIPARDIA